MKTKYKAAFLSLMLASLFVVGVIYADSNGIWHLAKDVRPGTFGDDEGDSTSYTFVNPVTFTNNVQLPLSNSVTYEGIELDTKYVEEGQVNSITSAMITDGQVTSSDVNFNYAASNSKGGNATNSDSCNSDGNCDIATATVSGEIKVNTIRSNGNGNVVIVIG